MPEDSITLALKDLASGKLDQVEARLRRMGKDTPGLDQMAGKWTEVIAKMYAANEFAGKLSRTWASISDGAAAMRMASAVKAQADALKGLDDSQRKVQAVMALRTSGLGAGATEKVLQASAAAWGVGSAKDLSANQLAPVMAAAGILGRQGLKPDEQEKILTNLVPKLRDYGHFTGYDDALGAVLSNKTLAKRSDAGDLALGLAMRGARLKVDDQQALVKGVADGSVTVDSRGMIAGTPLAAQVNTLGGFGGMADVAPSVGRIWMGRQDKNGHWQTLPGTNLNSQNPGREGAGRWVTDLGRMDDRIEKARSNIAGTDAKDYTGTSTWGELGDSARKLIGQEPLAAATSAAVGVAIAGKVIRETLAKGVPGVTAAGAGAEAGLAGRLALGAKSLAGGLGLGLAADFLTSGGGEPIPYRPGNFGKIGGSDRTLSQALLKKFNVSDGEGAWFPQASLPNTSLYETNQVRNAARGQFVDHDALNRVLERFRESLVPTLERLNTSLDRLDGTMTRTKAEGNP